MSRQTYEQSLYWRRLLSSSEMLFSVLCPSLSSYRFAGVKNPRDNQTESTTDIHRIRNQRNHLVTWWLFLPHRKKREMTKWIKCLSLSLEFWTKEDQESLFLYPLKMTPKEKEIGICHLIHLENGERCLYFVAVTLPFFLFPVLIQEEIQEKRR